MKGNRRGTEKCSHSTELFSEEYRSYMVPLFIYFFKDAILTHCWVSQSFNVLFKTCDAQREAVWQILLYF